MSAIIDSAKKFQDLLDIKEHGTPYFFEKIFPAESWTARLQAKNKFKLLKNIHNQLEAMLHEDEKVCFLTSGMEESFFESIFLGQLMYYINRKAFIFTTQRLIILQINISNKPTELRAQIDYSSIKKIDSTSLGKCKIKFKNGKTSIFAHIPKKDKKFMKEVIDQLSSSLIAADSNTAGLENLCPHCYVKIEGFPEKCEVCGKGFKLAAKAGWLSLLFPGLGDFYLGQHKFLAAFEILGALLIWFVYFMPEPAETAQPRTFLDYAIGAVIIIILAHGLDSLVTRHIAKKGIYPAK